MASSENLMAFDNSSEWLLPEEAARYIRVFKRDKVTPCVQRIRNLISQKRLRAYKPFGRLLLKKSELDLIIETSVVGGNKWR